MDGRKVLVDADACPKNCLRIVQQLSAQYQLKVVTVASFNHVIDNAEHVTVGNEADAADLAIMNRVCPADIVVTQDWGLAALVLGKKAKAIAPTGRIYTDERMGQMLEERSLLAKYRRGGGRTKGPSKRSAEDDVRFGQSFEKLLQQIE